MLLVSLWLTGAILEIHSIPPSQLQIAPPEAVLSFQPSGLEIPRLREQPEQAPALEPKPREDNLQLTPTPIRKWIPQRIVIPAIGLDAPVVPVGFREIRMGNRTVRAWETPNFFAAGWHRTSAPLGMPGNTVLNGHHNIYGEVFRDLVRLKPGDRILVYSGDRVFVYEVREKHIIPERGRPLREQLAHARWIQSTKDERLTLITCWPYTSNTHRLILIARPISATESLQKRSE